MTETQRIVCAIDCGSTSVRCSIAEVTGDDWTLVEDAERPLNLLAAIQRNRFNRNEMDYMIQACRDVLELARSYGAEAIRAVASPSLRDLSNVDVLLELVRLNLGLDFEIIDGAEEGRLYHQALTRILQKEDTTLQGDQLLMDLGSSTSSVSWVRDRSLVQTVEEHVGTERIVFRFEDQQDAEILPDSLDRIALGASRVLMNRLERPGDWGPKFTTLLITGRGPRILSRMFGQHNGSLLPRISKSVLDSTFREVRRLPPLERNEWAKKHRMHLPGLLTSLSLMRRLCEATRVDEVLVPELQLRVGLLMDFLSTSYGPHRLAREHLTAAASELSARYGTNDAYSKNTASLACQLFDATVTLHSLSKRARLLLELAALLHDVGAHINVRSRHKHTFYILSNVDISGLTSLERDVVAHVARYHRGKVPQSSHEEFNRLDRSSRMLVSALAAILRVAYALDVERSQRIKQLKCRIDGSIFRIETDVQNVALERWSMARKGGLFKTVFGLNVQVVPEHTGRRV